VAQAVRALGLRYVVITSVTRDDLPDGGAAHFARTIQAIREDNPDCGVEVLIPDFQGSAEALRTVLAAGPDVLNHNLETVPRLYSQVRPQASYQRSLELLRRSRDLGKGILTKSGLMVGLGETWDELLAVMADLRVVGCDLLTLGQYLRPSVAHLPISRYYTPQEFEALTREGRYLGFRHVEAGPLVRSSYHAHRQAGHP
jgi:lipoic acid synthetase